MLPPASRRVLSLVAVLLSLVAATRLIRGASVAAAAVEHGVGYSATVLGYTSWYGSYRMGDVEAWCIDHGSHAPDAAFGYAPTPVDDVPDTTRRAIAWAAGAHGNGADRPTAAALMLVAHDLMGAVYPHGRIDVDALTAADLAGFGDDGEDVVARAAVIKADALAHAALVPPLQLTIEMDAGVAVARVTDAAGTPVAGVEVAVVPTGPAITGAPRAATGADGSASFPYTEVLGEDRIDASATVPDLELHALASTSHPAQRVAVPTTVTLTAVTGYEVLPPTTTSSSTTSTTSSSTTSTTSTTSTSTTSTTTTAPQIAVATTTTAPPTTTTVPPTTSTIPPPPPSTTAPTTTAPPPTTAPTTTVEHTAPVTQPLPRTGSPTGALACTGLGLVLLGAALRRAHAPTH